MQNQEQEKGIRQELKEKLEILAKMTSESLVRAKDLGTRLDFRDGVEAFERTLKLFRELKGANLEDFPDPIINTLLGLSNTAIDNFERIKSFQPDEETSPGEVRDNIIQQVENQYDNQFNQIYPILSYSFGKGTDFESLVGEAKIVVSKAKEEVKKAENASQQIDGILTAAKKAAPVIGLSKYAVIFKDEADAHKKKARSWLIATVCLAGFTLILGVKSFSYYIEVIKDMNTAQSIQIGLAKLVILAVLYFGIVWSGRIYKAQQHNCVVNQHRHNALATFEIFVNSTEDKETKNAVLVQTTKAIFSPQHSGFSAQEKELSASPQILEIIRPFIGGAKE